MAKIVCEECGSEYKLEIAKNMKNCPVCNVPFEEEPAQNCLIKIMKKWWRRKLFTIIIVGL